ncbi:MAG: phosphomannomutase/phosphoglucomutase [Phycisphaerales bacterium]
MQTTQPAAKDMLAKIFKAYDVRGIYPQPLDEGLAWRIGFAAAQYYAAVADREGRTGDARAIVVGRDMRRSSPALAGALKQGMRAAGAQIVDVGMVDTPFVGFAVNQLGAAGGVQTTASHNPSNYNGFKFCGPKATPMGQDSGLSEIQRLAQAADPSRAGVAATGGERTADLWDAYRAKLLGFLPPQVIDGTRRLRVVIDASNGMAGTMVPKVFAGVKGLEITAINFDNSTGEFVHEPNPLVEANLRWTREGIRAQRADFGVCFDGDADRCMVVDEQGTPIGCDLMTAWLGTRWLRADPGAAIVYDLRSTRSLSESVAAAGGRPVESRVGHVFMKQKLRETGAPFGGELSGHFYYRDMGCIDNGARAFIDVVSALVEAGRPLSECIAPLRRYVQSGEINFENADKQGALAALRAKYPQARFQELDGLSMDCGDWWCNVRLSNTEPLLRLNLEARSQATVDAKVRELEPILGHRVDH